MKEFTKEQINDATQLLVSVLEERKRHWEERAYEHYTPAEYTRECAHKAKKIEELLELLNDY